MDITEKIVQTLTENGFLKVKLYVRSNHATINFEDSDMNDYDMLLKPNGIFKNQPLFGEEAILTEIAFTPCGAVEESPNLMDGDEIGELILNNYDGNLNEVNFKEYIDYLKKQLDLD